MTALITIIAIVVMRNIIHSPTGRAYTAIGEDETAAAAVDVGLVYHKLQ